MVRPSVDREALAQQLQNLRKYDGLADEGRLEREAPLLLRLASETLALENSELRSLVPRAFELLDDAIHCFSPSSQEILRAGLNWNRDATTSVTDRLLAFLESRGLHEPGHLRERERALYLPLADFLLEALRVTQARRAHEALACGDGDPGAAAAFVVEHYRAYYRVFSPAGAVGNDLKAWLIRRWREPDVQTPDEYLDNAIYCYAQWQLAERDLIQDLAGNWIASDADTETKLVATHKWAEQQLPFSDWDNSLLMIALLEAPHQLRVTFESNLHAGNLYTRYRRRLRTWLKRCNCNPKRPKKQCEPHQAIQAIQQLTILIDREWYRLAKWYRLPPETVSGERDDVGHYFLHADPENYDLLRLDHKREK